MPNTLIHIAIQAPASSLLFRRIEIPWILAGAIIPDIPWIFQRLCSMLQFADPYQARLYFTAQASLALCLFLCAALAAFSAKPSRVFAVLAFNCLLHLLLDALQTKWGNGVHLLAPFNWHLTSYGILWPEHILGYAASIFGIFYLAIKYRKIDQDGLNLTPNPKGKLAIAALIFYFTLPFTFMDQLEKNNASEIKTLKSKETMAGKTVAFDRSYYSRQDNKITIFSGETFTLTGNIPDKSGTVSIKGQFISAHTIKANRYHFHNGYRNYASYAGLFLSLIIWTYILFAKRRIVH